jgi:hypothetical protein
MQRPFPNGQKYLFGYNGYVTAMAVGQRQRLYSRVRTLTVNYLSSFPRELREGGGQLELKLLKQF